MTYKALIAQANLLQTLKQTLKAVSPSELKTKLNTILTRVWEQADQEIRGTKFAAQSTREQEFRKRFRNKHWVRKALDQAGAPLIIAGALAVAIVRVAEIYGALPSPEIFRDQVWNLLVMSAGLGAKLVGGDYEQKETAAWEREQGKRPWDKSEEDLSWRGRK